MQDIKKQIENEVALPRALEQELRRVVPMFSQAFNNAETSPELKKFLNELTPSLIAYCFWLECYAEKKETEILKHFHEHGNTF